MSAEPRPGPASDAQPLAGRVALVTGAAGRGTGHATALALARDGADVVVNTERSMDEATRVVEEIRELGQRAIIAQGDVSNADDVARIFEEARAGLGTPAIVVASAGALWKPRPIDEIPPDEWRLALAEEIDALYLLARAGLPTMRAAGWGRIVAVGGFAVDQWTVAAEDGPIDYALGKAGRHWLVRTLALQEARHGVTVNAVAPGPITRIAADALVEAVLGSRGAEELRAPTQVDVANAIASLCASGAVNGAIVSLPGPQPGAVSGG